MPDAVRAGRRLRPRRHRGPSAVRDGDEWRIDGTKVWTSNAKIVSYGMLLARTNWDAPKHRGLSFFLCPAQQPGVEARPIKQMNGALGVQPRALRRRHGGRRRPARRRGRGLGGDPDVPGLREELVQPGRPRGRAVRARRPRRAGRRARRRMLGAPRPRRAATAAWVASSTDSVSEFGRTDDPHVRQDLAVLHTRRAILGYTNLRMRTASMPGLEGPISKITVSDITRAPARGRPAACRARTARCSATTPRQPSSRTSR